MTQPPGPTPPKPSPDEELDRERREPGLNTDGRGNAGADPAEATGDENSNT